MLSTSLQKSNQLHCPDQQTLYTPTDRTNFQQNSRIMFHSNKSAQLIVRALNTARAFSATAGTQRVGFIGLGAMGAHMARNLIKAGHDVRVFDGMYCIESIS